MNLLRQIPLAPGITVAVKDLDKTNVEFIASHYMAGHAVLRRCTDTREVLTFSGTGRENYEYWTIETAFYGSDPVPVVRGKDLDWTSHTDFLSIDAALAGLSVLGAQYVAAHPERAFQRAYQEMTR